MRDVQDCVSKCGDQIIASACRLPRTADVPFTTAIREYVLAKLDRITRHFDQVVDITVLLSIEKPAEKERRQKAEVTVHVKGKDLFAECTSEDLYAAIDQLMDKLDRQVVRHKDKVQNHHHGAPKRADARLT